MADRDSRDLERRASQGDAESLRRLLELDARGMRSELVQQMRPGAIRDLLDVTRQRLQDHRRLRSPCCEAVVWVGTDMRLARPEIRTVLVCTACRLLLGVIGRSPRRESPSIPVRVVAWMMQESRRVDAGGFVSVGAFYTRVRDLPEFDDSSCIAPSCLADPAEPPRMFPGWMGERWCENDREGAEAAEMNLGRREWTERDE